MLKLIASDIDGTLLRGGVQALNPELFDIIKEFKKKGVAFVASSGRPFSNLRRLFEPVKDDIYYVAENGTLYYINGELITTNELDRELGLEILREILKHPENDILLAAAHTSYTQSKNREYIDYVKNTIKYDLEVVNDITKVKDPFLKIAVCDFSGIENSSKRYIDLFSDKLSVVTSGSIWLDFIPKGASKGAALKTVLNSLSVKPSEIISFGDQYNDIEMFETSGKSYAVSTCAKGVEKYADEICDDPIEVMKEILGKL